MHRPSSSSNYYDLSKNKNTSVNYTKLRSLGGIRPRQKNSTKKSLTTSSSSGNLQFFENQSDQLVTKNSKNSHLSPSVEAVLLSNNVIKQNYKVYNEAKKNTMAARGIPPPDFSSQGNSPYQQGQSGSMTGNDEKVGKGLNQPQPKNHPPSIPTKYGPLFRPSSSTHSSIQQQLAKSKAKNSNFSNLAQMGIGGSNHKNNGLSQVSIAGPPNLNSHMKSGLSKYPTSGLSQIQLNHNGIPGRVPLQSSKMPAGLILDTTTKTNIPTAQNGLPLNIDLLTKKLNKLAQQQQTLDRLKRSAYAGYDNQNSNSRSAVSSPYPNPGSSEHNLDHIVTVNGTNQGTGTTLNEQSNIKAISMQAKTTSGHARIAQARKKAQGNGPLTTFTGRPLPRNDDLVNFKNSMKVEVTSSKPATAQGRRPGPQLQSQGMPSGMIESNPINTGTIGAPGALPPLTANSNTSATFINPYKDELPRPANPLTTNQSLGTLMSNAMTFNKIETLTKDDLIDKLVKRIVKKATVVKNVNENSQENKQRISSAKMVKHDHQNIEVIDEEDEDEISLDEEEDEEELAKAKTDNKINHTSLSKPKTDTPRLQTPKNLDTALSIYNQIDLEVEQESMYIVSSNNPEVPIEVSDTNNNTRKFFCPYNLLRHKIPFFQKAFGNVGPRYNNTDLVITVQCDILVFEMILDYAKERSGGILSRLERIDSKTLIAILVASEHLKMEQLFKNVLAHFIQNLLKITKQVSNVHNIPDNIFQKLVKYHPEKYLPEIYENLGHNKTQQKIFKFLSEDFVRNNASCGLFKCKFCHKILTKSVESYWSCNNFKIDYKGKIISSHKIDFSWDLNKYLKKLFKEPSEPTEQQQIAAATDPDKPQPIIGFNSNWKTLYYHIWALITTFSSKNSNCLRCNKKFQAISLNTCNHHPFTSIYPSVTGHDKILESRVGQHKCCGLKTYRFNITVNGNISDGGCEALDHVIDLDNLDQIEENNEIRNWKILEKIRPSLDMFVLKKPSQDRRTLLEIDNKNFMTELFIGNESAVKHTNQIEEKLETMTKNSASLSSTASSSVGNLVISVKMSKKSTKNLKKNLKNSGSNTNFLQKDGKNNSVHLWNKGKNVRWNQDSIRNNDLKRFEMFRKELKERNRRGLAGDNNQTDNENINLYKREIPASGVYQLIENRLIGHIGIKTAGRRK